MGKIRTRFIGDEKIEKKEKKEQKERSKEKKVKVITVEEKIEEKKEVDKKAEKKTVISKKRGKNYLLAKREIKQKLSGDLQKKGINLKQAIELLKKIKYAKFDESIELHIKILENSQHGEVKMPHSIGKELKVKIVDDNLLDQIEKGKIDFDILISHPSYMPKIVKFAKILGPRGLMPNPKAGTISERPEETAKKFEKGVLKWKSEQKQPLIHQQIGKISYDEKKIEENIKAFIESVGKAKVLDMYITSTMSPSIKIDASSV